MSAAELDKRRNKLGYRRISIACVHCRRRKIRCIPADGDPQERCQTCIRLKKDCVFHPVDPQSLAEGDSHGAGFPGVDNGTASTVSSSSPGAISEGAIDERRDSSGFLSLRGNTNRHFQGIPVEPGNPIPVQDPMLANQYGYLMRNNVRRSWDSSAFAQPHLRGAGVRPVEPGAPPDRAESWGFHQPPGDFPPFSRPDLPAQQVPHPFQSTYPAPNIPLYAYAQSDNAPGGPGNSNILHIPPGARTAAPHHGPMEQSAPLESYHSPYSYEAMNTYPQMNYPPHSLAVQNAPTQMTAPGGIGISHQQHPLHQPQQGGFAGRSYSLPHDYGKPGSDVPPLPTSYALPSNHNTWPAPPRPQAPGFGEEGSG